MTKATITKTRSMMTMTKAEALRIQAEQVAFYSRSYGPKVADLVAAATTADALADGEHPVSVINRHIPRGGALEWLIPEIREREEAMNARRREMGI